MTLWVDAQLSPALAPWLTERFGTASFSVKHLGYRDATDRQIFEAARETRAVVISKDSDFDTLLERFGPPPQVIWITAGNTSNARMQSLKPHSSPRYSCSKQASPLSKSVIYEP